MVNLNFATLHSIFQTKHFQFVCLVPVSIFWHLFWLAPLETFPKEKFNNVSFSKKIFLDETIFQDLLFSRLVTLLQRGSFEWKRQKRLAGTWQTNGQYFVLKLKRKPSKVLTLTFAYRSMWSFLYGYSGQCLNIRETEKPASIGKVPTCHTERDKTQREKRR